MESFFANIANLGFPIAVASYLLVRFEKKIERLEEKVDELTDAIKNKLTTSIDNLGEKIDNATTSRKRRI
jgi:hypothetical protein